MALTQLAKTQILLCAVMHRLQYPEILIFYGAVPTGHVQLTCHEPYCRHGESDNSSRNRGFRREKTKSRTSLPWLRTRLLKYHGETPKMRKQSKSSEAEQIGGVG